MIEGIILLLALLVRLIAINQSLWLDEAVQVWASQHFSLWGLLWHYMPGDFNPPLYHLISWGWVRLFGSKEWVVRLPSLIFGLISIWVLGKIAAALKWPRSWRRLLMLFLVLAPLHVYYSQENRMYMLALLAGELVIWRLLVLDRKRTGKNVLGLALALLAMAFSHFLTLFLLPVLAWFCWRRRIPWHQQIFLAAVLLIAYFLYSPLLWRQLVTGLGWQQQFPVWRQTVGSFSFKAALLLPVKFALGRISLRPRWFYGLTSLVLLLLGWLLPSLIFLRRWQAKRVSLEEKFIAFLVFFPPMLGFLLSHWIAVFSYFRFLYVLPFWYVFLIMEGKTMAKWGNLFLAIFLFLEAAFSGVYLFNSRFHRENWRHLASWLIQESQNQAPILVLSQISKPLDYYLRGQRPVCYLTTANDLDKCPLKKTVFLVSYGLPIFDPGDKIRWQLRRRGYKIRQGVSFRRVGGEKWEKEE